MNRRQAVVAGVVGAATGLVWTSGFGLLLNRHEPTLEVIGKGNSLLALLDTGSFRALFVVGDSASIRLGPLLGIFRRRIDLLAGSREGIATISASRSAGLRFGRTFVLNVPTGIIGSATVDDVTGPAVLRTTLPGGVDLELCTHIRDAWQPDVKATQTWTIEITRNGHRCMLAPSLDVISRHASVGLAVGIAVDGDSANEWDMLRVPVVAINANHVLPDTATDPGVSLFRVFPHDPLTFTFRLDGISIRE